MTESTSYKIVNITRNINFSLKTEICRSFFAQFRGLMFRKSIQKDESIVLAGNSNSIVGSSIHMFFMNFDISVIWVDSKFKVVDKVIAKKWHPYYASRIPAQYVIEGHPSIIEFFETGDHIVFSSTK